MSDLYTRLFAAGLFPLHERLKGHNSVAARRWMERTQWWEPTALRALQLERLRALLAHAGAHVPYYRRLFSSLGFDPEAVQSIEELRRLPFLDKPTIRREQDTLKSDVARGLTRMSTGGSSGEPLVFWLGTERVSHDVAAKWRATRWWGVDIGDSEVVLWGSPIELGGQDRIKRLRDWLQRSVLLPAFDMSDDKVRGFVDTIRARRPRMLFGYASALAHVAGFAEREGYRLDDIGCRVAFATGESLYEHQREVVERVFGCRVANGYGGRDAGFVAHQCPAGGLHITAEDVVVEVIDTDGNPVVDGEMGELVVTHLATQDFPFVRYRTGDVGALDDRRCSCGRGLPLLKNIQGRTTDFVVAADGTVMHGLALIYVVRELPGIRNFRIVQHSHTHVQIQIVTDRDFVHASVEALRAGFRARLGQAVEVKVEQVDEVALEGSGKHRYVISKVAPDSGRVNAA
ncbi:phenylacetate--CoA ligase family protein [Aquisalimonas sp. APHAB1-3]|uniref:phenylacetate--CoA ligase family protein n=1 Tax=Aquisalimonas sp. APHAB1-3 TaxID=3402080 RepID=UPI003AAF24A6